MVTKYRRKGEKDLQKSPNCDKISKNELSAEHIAAINAALSANLRVEIVATADGLKLYHVKRKELNN